MEISIGDIIKIGKDKYEVLNIQEDIDWFDTVKNEIQGKHTAIELHKVGDMALHPTHLLKFYHDNKKEAVLLKIVQDKPPSSIEHPRQRGAMFSHQDKKVIPVEKIERV